MKRRFLCAVIVGLLFSQTGQSAPAQTRTLTQELEAAKDLYQAGRFPQAAVALGSLIAKLDLRPEGESQKRALLEAHLHLALTYFALNDSGAAKESFLIVVRLDPAYQLNPERHAPGIVALLEEARQEAEAEPGASERSTPEDPTATQEVRETSRTSPTGPEDEQPPDWPLILTGAVGVGAGVGVGAALGGGENAATDSGTNTSNLDGDGDGFTLGEGDCDDSNVQIRPDGPIGLDIHFAFEGTVDCPTSNVRQQTYTIQNNSCSPFSFTRLEWQVSVIDTSGRTTNNLTTSLPVDVNVVGPGESAIIRRGPPGGTVQALCRDLSGPNPFSRPRGDLRVKEVYTITGGSRDLSSTNSFLVLNTRGCSFCSLDSIFGPYPLGERASESPQALVPVAWVNELSMAEGIGRVTLNGQETFSVGSGYSRLVGSGHFGENTIEATLVSGEGTAGTWRFDFESMENFETGQLRVLEGQATVSAPHMVLIRLNGRPGERVVFRFSIRP